MNRLLHKHGRALRAGLVSALAVLAACSNREAPEPPTAEGEAPGRPNVVLLIADTLRADVLGTYGDATGASEELDRLAEQAVVFDRVIAPAPWTKPSVGAMITGMYPRSLGLYVEKGEVLSDSALTLAEILQANGYRTVGLTANPNLNPSFNFDQGFNEYLGSTVVWPWMKDGTDGNSVLERRLKPARELYARALELVREDPDTPTFLFLDIMEMHEHERGAFQLAREEFRGLYPGKPFAPYWHALRQVSVDTAAFLDELRAVPGWSDTLFIFVSDHGEGLGDHPAVHRGTVHGFVLYESNISVPMFWRHPGALEPRRVEQPVRLLDLTPTLLDYLGIDPPHEMEGTSLVPLMKGGEVSLPDRFAVETYFRGSDKQGAFAAEWGYFEHHDDQRGFAPRELQANGVPSNGRKTNRIEEHPEIAGELAAYLRNWQAEHPKAAPTVKEGALSDEELQQLEAIGYLDAAPSHEPESGAPR